MVCSLFKNAGISCAAFLVVGSLGLGFMPDRAQAEEGSSVQDYLYDRYKIELFGFFEARGGLRQDRDGTDEKDASLGEGRLQLDFNRDFGWGIAKLKGDLVADLVTEEFNGELREANLLFSPLSFLDIKAGRQTITWGTGDLVFINDLFPKDWESFFIGRDDEYLKAPSDAVKASFFFEPVNIDLVYIPLFTPSTYIDGSRLSYFNPLAGRITGRDNIFADQERNRFFTDDALAVRLYRTFGSTELALYGYYGYWSTPEGIDPQTMKGTYPKLAVYGASLRRPLFGGIASLEGGYYDSRSDRSGSDPFIRNSEVRYLAAFERELAENFTGGIQYYVEQILDYSQYEQSLPASFFARDEYRHLFTLRLTKLLMQQNLKLSLFVYYSPSDEDAYLRPKVNYKISDQWTVETGGNLFYGSQAHTFFGQFEENSNIYAALRRSF